jgi:hypothetical protein
LNIEELGMGGKSYGGRRDDGAARWRATPLEARMGWRVMSGVTGKKKVSDAVRTWGSNVGRQGCVAADGRVARSTICATRHALPRSKVVVLCHNTCMLAAVVPCAICWAQWYRTSYM